MKELTQTLDEALPEFADRLKERFQGLDTEIEGLRKEIEILKREPRQSFSQKLKDRRL